MKNLVVSALLFVSFLSSAQTPNWLWAKRAGGLGHDFGTRISADALGNCYVTGYFQGPSAAIGNFTFTAQTGSNLFLAKYDSLGTVLWSKAGVTLGQSIGEDIKTDSNGNSYFLGSYTGPTLTLGSASVVSQNGCVVAGKIDQSGNVLWLKNVGYKNSAPYGHLAITIDGSGNSYVTGQASSNFSMPVDSLILTKLDNSGNVVWQKYATGTNWNTYSLATDQLGNSYVAGRISGGTSLDLHGAVLTNTMTGANIFIAKFDASGNLIWAKSAGNYPTLYEPSIAIDGSGNSIVAGHYLGTYAGFGSITLTNPAQGDLYVVKFDPLGNVLWAKGTGSLGGARAKGIVTDWQGNIFITGTCGSMVPFGTFTLTGSGGPEIFITKYDANGNVLWAKGAGGNGVDVADGISLGANNNLFITGSSFSIKNIFGSTVLLNSDTILGSNEIFVAKISGMTPPQITTSISEKETGQLKISVFPNPMKDQAFIRLSHSVNNAEITIFNALGQKVRRISGINGTKLSIDRNGLEDGIYFLQLSEENNVSGTFKVILSH